MDSGGPTSPLLRLIVPLILAAAAAALRRPSVAVVVAGASAAVIVLGVIWLATLGEEHSRWSVIPIAGLPAVTPFVVARHHALRERPIAALVVSFVAVMVGVLAGLIVAVELDLVHP